MGKDQLTHPRSWSQTLKIILKVLGVIVVCLVVALVVLRITGLPPHDGIPGLWLKGDLVTTPVTDWSFTDHIETVKVQTNTWYGIPHSVTTNCVAYDGQLYLTSVYPAGVVYPNGRNWNANVARDPHVRIKIGNNVYDRVLSYVTDPAEHAAVFQMKRKKYPNQVIAPNATVIEFHVLGN
jgi:hypothetical protein